MKRARSVKQSLKDTEINIHFEKHFEKMILYISKTVV